jgi:hypothetical protein
MRDRIKFFNLFKDAVFWGTDKFGILVYKVFG